MKSETSTSQPLLDSIALVTGSGRGIGAATAELLAARGARVFLCSRTITEIEAVIHDLRKKFGTDRVAGTSIDLAQEGAPNEVFDSIEKEFGAPARILVNNAAIGYRVPFLETSPEEMRQHWDAIQAVNARTPYLLSHEFMRRIALVGDSNGTKGGAIVNIGSLGGIRATSKFPGLSAYVTSKFAIAGMTEALAVEGKSIGVRVNAVAPGAVDTKMLREAAPQLQTETRPADVAKVIAYLCDPVESGALSGAVIEIHSNID